MTDKFDVGHFSYLAKKLLDRCENGDEFFLRDVHKQVREAYEKFPEDTIIRQMAFVIEKKAEKSGQFAVISQKQISELYNDLVRLSGDSKFRVVLGHLLFPVEAKKSSPEIKHDLRPELKVSDLVSGEAIGVLASAFSDDLASKHYDEKLAAKGVDYVKAELKSVGLDTHNVKVAGGNADRIFYAAGFDSGIGTISVYIPAKVSGSKIEFPNTFVDDQGEKALSLENLKASLERRGLVEQNVAGEINRADYSLPVIETPKAEMPKELAHLAHDFENDVLESVCSFGRKAVENGKRLIVSELRSAGVKNAQVRFGSESDNSIVYLAAINTPRGSVEIEVPVEMAAIASEDKYAPLIPSYFAYDGLVEAFNTENIQRFASNPPTPSSTQGPSLYSYMTLPELKEELIKAAQINDYVSCEGIIDHVGSAFSEEDHRNIIADYQYVLGIKSKASDALDKQQAISKQAGTIIPAGKGSILPRLANGRPIKDMVMDKDGRFRSATEIEREKINPTKEGGALISTSKILLT